MRFAKTHSPIVVRGLTHCDLVCHCAPSAEAGRLGRARSRGQWVGRSATWARRVGMQGGHAGWACRVGTQGGGEGEGGTGTQRVLVKLVEMR